MTCKECGHSEENEYWTTAKLEDFGLFDSTRKAIEASNKDKRWTDICSNCWIINAIKALGLEEDD